MNEKELQDAIIHITTLEQKYQAMYPQWRRGQTLFNSLYALYPEVADGLRATDVDPFHRDDRYGACWEHIIKVLKTDDFQP